MKEEYRNISLLLEQLKYKEHSWQICVDLKMVNFFLRQRAGRSVIVGKQNVIYSPLVNQDQIILPPLHIKLGIMKQLVEALNKDGECFT